MDSKKIFSRTGLGLALYLAVSTAFAFGFVRIMNRIIPQTVQQPWFTWFSSSISIYVVGFLVLYLFLRTIPKDS